MWVKLGRSDGVGTVVIEEEVGGQEAEGAKRGRERRWRLGRVRLTDWNTERKMQVWMAHGRGQSGNA